MKAERVFECGRCYRAHYDEDEAFMCCSRVHDRWQCDKCHEVYDKEHEAETCCT